MWWHTRRNWISSFGETDESISIGGARQFSRLLAAEVCASVLVMLDTPCSEVVWRVLATHYIRQFSLHFSSLRHRVPSHFHWTVQPCKSALQPCPNLLASTCDMKIPRAYRMENSYRILIWISRFLAVVCERSPTSSWTVLLMEHLAVLSLTVMSVYWKDHTISIGNSSYFSVLPLLRSKAVSRTTKVRMYKTIIRPVVLYGSEAWCLTAIDEEN